MAMSYLNMDNRLCIVGIDLQIAVTSHSKRQENLLSQELLEEKMLENQVLI